MPRTFSDLQCRKIGPWCLVVSVGIVAPLWPTSLHATCSTAVPPPFQTLPDKSETVTTGNGTVLASRGADGCNNIGNTRDNGNPGQAGQNSGNVTQTVAPAQGQTTPQTTPVGAVSVGGNGGNGADVYFQNSIVTTNRRGGFAGSAGSPGDVKLTFDGVVMDSGRAPSLLARSDGGAGGRGGLAFLGQLGSASGRLGGSGGSGGNTDLISVAEILKTSGNVDATAISASANGGDAGDGGDARAGGGGANAGGGGTAGTGGSASVTLRNRIETSGVTKIEGAVVVDAKGGKGGNAGVSLEGTSGKPQRGGTGGNGGNALLTMGLQTSVSATSSDQKELRAALLSKANGGLGGAGSGSHSPGLGAGDGGFGGAGGSSSITIQGAVTTHGSHLHGGLAQAIAGVGGDGGDEEALFKSVAGDGGTGGSGGEVYINADPGSDILVIGENSIGLLAQSIGGGGGAGGNATALGVLASVAIGGYGGAGGDGGVRANITLDDTVLTNRSSTDQYSTQAGGGALVQNIGGNGGHAGSAVSGGMDIVTLAIGNQGGGGGAAGPAKISSKNSVVTTYGDHAVGLEAQSIGGGGGKGGTAITTGVSAAFVATSVSLGGSGGSGGTGGVAEIDNSSQVVTYGPDATAIKSSSIGGGGGHGGASMATAYSVSQFPEVPSVSVAVSLGGAGGSASPGGTSSINNSGFVATAGNGAQALLVQSVGGGGGFGGDSSATSFAGGGTDIKLDVNVAIGGHGGIGAHGGTVTLDNSGFLATYGQDAHAILAQSVGGSGGVGGGTDGNGIADDADKFSFSTSVNLGGKSGNGSTGGEVDVTNTGGIGTRGDGSNGILAQSIGGGGGAGGSGSGGSGGGNLSVAVSIGGNDGDGHEGGKVVVNNQNTIMTSGIQSIGIQAQSVGGGGGKGGKAGTTASGSSNVSPAPLLQSTLVNNLGGQGKTDEIKPGVIKIRSHELTTDNIDPSKIEKLVSFLEGEKKEGNQSKSLSVAVTVGGHGGNGGHGGHAEVVNSSIIQTNGAYSDAILVQSIGGGGGSGGGAVDSTTSDNNANFSFSLGGGGGAGGAGGDAFVTTEGDSDIQTTQSYANGIFAQSVGGGGGKLSASSAKNFKGGVGGTGLGIAIGGNGGGSGAGGNTTVAQKAGKIVTSGRHAIGIFAQSVGGGGGLVGVTETVDTERDADNHKTDFMNFNLSFGGNGVSGGDAGIVDVNMLAEGKNTPSIQTKGRNSHAILAQSIGAFGGTVQGGKTFGINFFKHGSAGRSGDGGEVTVSTVGHNSTSGDGAYGILAQSIGGGGGIGGDLADGGGFLQNTQPDGGSGNGNTVRVFVDSGSVVTEGDNAHGVFVQSVGGGGGHIVSDSGVWSKTAGGVGFGGIVEATVGTAKTSAIVQARGANSDGLSLQSDGGSGANPITVNIGKYGTVMGGTGAGYAVRIRGGTGLVANPNVLNNAGTISPYGGSNGGAIWSDQPTTVNNTGHITGKIHAPKQTSSAAPSSASASSGITIYNKGAGVITTSEEFSLGTGGAVHNSATLEIGQGSKGIETVLTGDLRQTEKGILLLDLDSNNQNHDRIRIEGNAHLDGQVLIRPISLNSQPIPIISATGAVNVHENFAVPDSLLMSFNTKLDGQTVWVAPQASFDSAEDISDKNQSLANHIQKLWESDVAEFGTGLAQLADISHKDGYKKALNTLSGSGVSAVAASRLEWSHRFLQNAFSCPVFVGDTALLTQKECTWLRYDRTFFEQKENNHTIGYDGSAWTTVFGGQREIYPGWFLSGAMGYEQNSVNSNVAKTSTDGSSAMVVSALKYQRGPLLLAGALDFGYGRFDSTRRILLPNNTFEAKASSNSYNTGLHFKAAYQVTQGSWYLQPSVELSATYLRLDGYKETGAGAFNLDVESSDEFIYSLTPEVQVGKRIDMEGGAILNAYLKLGVTANSQDEWTTTARFPDSPSSAGTFKSVLGTPSTLGRLDLGIEVFRAGRISLEAAYQVDFAKDYSAQSANFRLNWLF